MQHFNEIDQQSKNEWVRPELVDLDLDMNDVQNGAGIGSDGAGGFSTSAS
ncbi:MAG: hypothetical protein Q7T68_14820 [Sphingopyxis sp.]|nr:hypothetical protein [Sphingopyxis sp.]